MKNKILSFLLCFSLLFSFPFITYGSDYTLVPDYMNTTVTGNGYMVAGPPDMNFDGSLILWEFDKINTSQITECSFCFNINGDFAPNDIVTINYANTLGGFIFNSASGFVRENGKETAILLNSSTGTITYTVVENCNSLFVYFSSSNITKSSTSSTPSTRFKVTLSVETAETGLLKTIIEYIKGIFSDLQDLPNKISDFFADLKNNLSSLFADVGEWFSQLGDNLKQWFESVGEWFSQLGDNLKQWFEDVGNWFSELFSNISAFFTGLWDDFTAWFKSLFIPRDVYLDYLYNYFGQWLSDHLGFIAQSFELIVSLLTTISNLDGSTTGIITFPEIKLPFFDNPILLAKQDFDLLGYINSIPALSNVYSIYKTIVTAFFIFLFIRFAYKKFNEILKGREVTD